MDVNYPGLRDDTSQFLKTREQESRDRNEEKAKVYFWELIDVAIPRLNVTLKKNSPRFDGDFAVRQCIYVILRSENWKRIGTKKQVQNPVFEKVLT